MNIVFILIGLIILIWLYSMYLSWNFERSVPLKPIERIQFVFFWNTIERFVRKWWYRTLFYIEIARKKIISLLQRAIIKLIPRTADLFKKHDTLKGLHEGPSSYFLQRISSPGPKKKASSLRAKKML